MLRIPNTPFILTTVVGIFVLHLFLVTSKADIDPIVPLQWWRLRLNDTQILLIFILQLRQKVTHSTKEHWEAWMPFEMIFFAIDMRHLLHEVGDLSLLIVWVAVDLRLSLHLCPETLCPFFGESPLTTEAWDILGRQVAVR